MSLLLSQIVGPCESVIFRNVTIDPVSAIVSWLIQIGHFPYHRGSELLLSSWPISTQKLNSKYSTYSNIYFLFIALTIQLSWIRKFQVIYIDNYYDKHHAFFF